MSSRNTIAPYSWGTLWALNAATPMFFGKDYRNAVFTLTLWSSFSWTVTFYQSNAIARPDLSSSAVAVTNEYTTVQTINLTTGATIAGSTWLVATWSSDGIIMLEVNTNYASWVGCKITAYAAGTVWVQVSFADNE